jgi:hypothetical protein
MRQGGLVTAFLALFTLSILGFSDTRDSKEISLLQNGPLTTDADGRVIIRRLDGPIELDGLSDEPAWGKIEPLPQIKHSPNFGEEPTERTVALVGFDEDYLYVAGRLYDSEPSKIYGYSKDRDTQNPSNDFFGIFIDTFNDKENALGFFTTPAGLRWDAHVFNDAVMRGPDNFPVNFSWNTFWDVAVVCNEEGWFVEMRIPLSSLRFQDKDGRVVMGMITWRWIARKNEIITFPAIRPDSGFRPSWKPSRAQEVVLEGVRSRKPLYIAPYALGGHSQTFDLNDEGTAYKRFNDPVTEAGLDIKYGPTSNLTLDLTVNTDFAQVEADDVQVNLTRFSLFFPEKRLFFQERASIFEFSFGGQNSLFYSRRIGIYEYEEEEEFEPVRIYGGARVVGRAGGWDLGFLNMQTAPFKDIASENFGVLRLRRRVFNPFSYVGGMITSKIGTDGSYNVAYGLDGIFRLFGEDYLSLNWAQSFEDEAANKVISLDPSRFRISWERRKTEGVGYNLSLSHMGKDYNPGMGFEMREDYLRFGARLLYGWIPGDESFLNNHYIFLRGSVHQRNSDHRLESAEFGPGWFFETKSGYMGMIRPQASIEDLTESFELPDDVIVPTGKYSFYGLTGFVQTPAGRIFSVNTTFDAGTFFDGWRVTVGIEPRWSLSSTWSLSGFYQFNRIEFPDRQQQCSPQIARLRLNATFTTKLSASAFIQYDGAGDIVIANLRFRFNPREGNDLYIVYNHGLNTDRYREVPYLPYTDGRAIMIKYTYTFNVK